MYVKGTEVLKPSLSSRRVSISLAIMFALSFSSFVPILSANLPIPTSPPAGTRQSIPPITAAATTTSSGVQERFVGGHGTGNLSYPQGVAIDKSGNVYVVDSLNARIQKFGPTGTLLGSFQISRPYDNTGLVGIAVDNNGFIYISQSIIGGGEGYVYKLSSNGTLVLKWSLGAFAQTGGITADNNGNLYVAVAWDYGPSNGIMKFTDNGALCTTCYWTYGDRSQKISTRDQLSMMFISLVYDGSGHLFAATRGYQDPRDPNNPNNVPPKIVEVDANSGNVLQAWTLTIGAGSTGSVYPFGPITGITMGTDGMLYFAVPSNHQIYRLDPRATNVIPAPVTSFLKLGDYSSPGWIAHSSDGTTFYVTDQNLDKVYIVKGGAVSGSFGRSSLHGAIMVAADASGNLYTIDGGAGVTAVGLRISKFDSSYNIIERWDVGVSGEDMGHFSGESLAVDSSGNIYAFMNPNRGSCCEYVLKYDNTGKLLAVKGFAEWVATGTADAQGNVYMVMGSGKVYIYDATLALKGGNWSNPGTRGIAYFNGSVYTLSSDPAYVRRYTLTGTQTAQFAFNKEHRFTSLGTDGLNELALDSFGNIYISDLISSVWKMDQKGNITGQFVPGCPVSVAAAPSGIYVGSRCYPSNVGVHFYQLTSISGRVTDASGKGLGKVLVTAAGANGILWKATTDSSGAYFISLPAGRYVVAAIPPVDSGLIPIWYNNQISPSGAKVVDLSTSVSINFTLASSQVTPSTDLDKVSVGGQDVITTQPMVNVHTSFEVSYNETAPEFYTSGKVTLVYADGRIQQFPMNITSVKLDGIQVKISGSPEPYWDGTKLSKARVIIDLDCPPGFWASLKSFVHFERFKIMDLALVKVEHVLAHKGLTFAAGTATAGSYVLTVVATDETIKWLSKEVTQLGRDFKYNDPEKNMVSWLKNGMGVSSSDLHNWMPNIIDANGEVIDTDEAKESFWTAMTVVVQYLQQSGKLDGFTPGLLQPSGWVPLTPNQAEEDPYYLMKSTLNGWHFNPATHSMEPWWQKHPLDSQDWKNIAEITGAFNAFLGADGKVKKDCVPKRLTFGIGLYDPSGTITDSMTGLPIAGATVKLYFLNQTSGRAQIVSDPALFLPNTNPEITDMNGKYGWDVAPGNYFIEVSAHGYQSANSTVVNIPPPVTDLNMKLVQLPKPASSLSVTDAKTGDNGWFVSMTVRLSLTSGDSLGLKAMYYQIDSSAEQVVPTTGKNASTSFSVSGDGVHTLKYWSVGADGYVEATRTYIVAIDSSPPRIYIKISGPQIGFTPSIVVIDDMSGVGKTAATLDGSAYSFGSAISSPGTYTLLVTATDLAGNAATNSMSFTIAGAQSTTTVALETSTSLQTSISTSQSELSQPSFGQNVLLLAAAGAAVVVVVGLAMFIRARKKSRTNG